MPLSRIAFFSKSLFPPLSLLKKHDVQHYCVTLTSGQVLIAHGGFAHYGFSTTAGETLSLASNLFTQEWLKEGGPQFLVEYGVWVQHLATLEDEVGGRAEFEQLLSSHGLTLDQLANALNVCPPAYTCQLLHALKVELQDHLQHPDRCVCGPYALTKEEATSVLQLVGEAHHLLHAARPFLERYYVDPSSEYCQVCCCCTSSSDSGSNNDNDNDDDDNTTSLHAHLATVAQNGESDLNQVHADHEPSIVTEPSFSPSSPPRQRQSKPRRQRRRIITDDNDKEDDEGEHASRLTAAMTISSRTRSTHHSPIDGESGQATDEQLEEMCRVIDPSRVTSLMVYFAPLPSPTSIGHQSLDATAVLVQDGLSAH